MRTVPSIIVVSFCLAAATVNAQLTTGDLTQINECVQPGAVQGSDLVGCSLKFNGLGQITFSVKNRGTVGINTPQTSVVSGQTVRKTTPSGPPIELALYLQNQLIATLTQPALGAGQTKTITATISSNYQTPGCGDARALKLVIDPKNQHAETSEGNNLLDRAAAKRPCPDLAIKSIKRNEQGLLNETYGVRVTVINQGNAPSPSNAVWGTSLPDGVWPITGWPELVPVTTMKALEPGETTSFSVGGSVLAGIRTSVRVVVDYHRKVEELEEGNNMKDERL